MVNTVVSAGELDGQALNIAREIAGCRQSVIAARRLMRGSVEETIARIDEEVEAFKTRLASPEAQRHSRLSSIGSVSDRLSVLRERRDRTGYWNYIARRTSAAGELEGCVALFERGLSVFVAEAGHRCLTVRRRCWLVQVQEALATAATTLVFNREGLRSGHRIHRGDNCGSSDERA